MTEQEQADNERISQWFEPKPEMSPNCALNERSDDEFWIVDYAPIGSPRSIRWSSRLDFHTDESANAILRDAMPAPSIVRVAETQQWEVEYDYRESDTHCIDPDYKRAIVGAFLLFIDANPRPI